MNVRDLLKLVKNEKLVVQLRAMVDDMVAFESEVLEDRQLLDRLYCSMPRRAMGMSRPRLAWWRLGEFRARDTAERIAAHLLLRNFHNGETVRMAHYLRLSKRIYECAYPALANPRKRT